jgi:hypothetical protein
MNEPQSITPSIPIPPPQPGIFGTKIPSSVAFAIGILLFFMPFVELRCNGMAIQKISGFELATGFKVKSQDDSFLGNMDRLTNENIDNNNTAKKERKDPNTYAIAALVMGVLGLALSFAAKGIASIGGTITGVLSAACLILLLIDLKKKLKTELTDTVSMGNTGEVRISLDFTPVFYISVIVFLAAAFFSYKRLKT